VPTPTYEYELARFGVQLGYANEDIIKDLLEAGLDEQAAKDLLAKVRERWLSPDEE